MRPEDIIDDYVAAVAAQLPARQRKEIAAELHSQLMDELTAAEARDSDAALALVRRYGRPAEVAARYSTPVTIIDPADTRSFAIAAMAGALLVPPVNPRLPISVDRPVGSLLVLAWIGTLVLFFAARAWAIRRWPERFVFTPKPPRAAINIPAEWCAALALIMLEVVYLSPAPIVDFVSGGRVPADHLAYSTSFVQPLRMWWFALMLPLIAALHFTAALRRSWNAIARALASLFLISAGIQLNWNASYGDILANVTNDLAARLTFQLAGSVLVLLGLFALYRQWASVSLPELKRRFSQA